MSSCSRTRLSGKQRPDALHVIIRMKESYTVVSRTSYVTSYGRTTSSSSVRRRAELDR